MLINLSNHPLNKWGEKQQNIAKQKYGLVSDLPFPDINPNWTTEEVSGLAVEYFSKLVRIFDHCANKPTENAVHIQGEFTFVFNLVSLLKKSKIKCIASTSERKVQEIDGKKIVEFNFVQFRDY